MHDSACGLPGGGDISRRLGQMTYARVLGRLSEFNGRYGPLRSRLASRRGSAEVVHCTELRSVETSPQCALGVAQGARTTRFFERGLHPTVEPGHCRWRHRRLDPLV